MAIFSRVLLKLSGEVLAGSQSFGYDPAMLEHLVGEIRSVVEQKVQLGIVIGGGNIFRGRDAKNLGVERATADYMGMMATVMNAMALNETLNRVGILSRVQSALNIEQVESYIRLKSIRYLKEDKVVIYAAGTGNPFFTTDTAAALRASEIGAQAVLKATKVDGIYDDDPMVNSNAKKYTKVSFDEALHKDLRIMDSTAFALCRDQQIPIYVFNIYEKGALAKLLQGEAIGTVVGK